MNKKQRILIEIAFALLFTGIALVTSTNLSASSGVVIFAFDQNPAGSDEGTEGLEGSMSNENEVFDFIFDKMDKVTYHIELGDQYSDEGDWSNATQEYHNGSIEANYAVVWLQNTKIPADFKNVKEQAIAFVLSYPFSGEVKRRNKGEELEDYLWLERRYE